MIPVTSFAGKKVALFGLGGSGLASAQALAAGGAEVIAFDDSAASVAKAKEAGIATEDLRKIDWSKMSALILAPGVPLTHPAPHWVVGLAGSAAVEVIGDVELYCRERRKLNPDSPFIAITGTNGKSTTTALLAHLLIASGRSAESGGNLGTPILSLESPRPAHAHVIECSSYQIDLAPTIDPRVGIMINVSEDHIDRHGTLEHYAAVKERLNPSLRIAGLVLTMVDPRTTLARQVEEEVRAHFPELSFRTTVPRNVRLAEAPSHGVPVSMLDPHCAGSDAYFDLAVEVVDHA